MRELSETFDDELEQKNELREEKSLDDITDPSEINQEFESLYLNKFAHCPIEGNGGHYDGERGNSNWYPDKEVIPGDRNGTNAEHQTWGGLLNKYGIEKIPFKDGEPDFSEISKGTVEIDEFTSERDANFDQADERLAKQKGCDPEEVLAWRKENQYSWHECRDCTTMEKVPREIHGNITHSGGISQAKNAIV